MEWQTYLTARSVLTTAAVLTIGRILWNLTFNLLSPPFPSSIPGPFIARLTDKWILFVDLAGSRASTVHALHQKYGPVVRLAPNELSFASLEAAKPIHGPSSTCIKSPAYDNFGRRGLFQTQDPELHRQRQRRVSHIFSTSLLQQVEPLVQSVVDQLVYVMEQKAGNPVDALHWCRMTALDVSGEVLMGKSFGAFDGGNQASNYVQKLDNSFLAWALTGIAPLLCQALSLLPIKELQKFFNAGDYVYKYGDDALKEYLKLHGRTSARRTLLTKLLAGDPITGAAPLPDEQISVEVSNLVFAGTDTTGNTIAYALYRLCCHPEWQDKLRAELHTSGAASTDFSFQTLQTLPVLNGIVAETLRLHPAAPSGLPRVTTARRTNISGLDLPADTLVSMPAYTTQRSATHFPDPDTFDPARWITDDGQIFQGTPEVQQMMLVWGGKGPRSCPGQHIAKMEIKIVVARLVERFVVRLESERTHAEMEMTDHFTLIPRGRRCGLVFVRV